MKDQDLFWIAGVAAAGYLFYKWVQGSGWATTTTEGGYYPANAGVDSQGFITGDTAVVLEPKTQAVLPESTRMNIFTPTTEGAADRFIVAPGSGGGGVYDRYAQQSIRTETATQRALFGTPGGTPGGGSSSTSNKVTPQPQPVAPQIKKLFQEGKNPQSVMK
jgi:hypothetical protein